MKNWLVDDTPTFESMVGINRPPKALPPPKPETPTGNYPKASPEEVAALRKLVTKRAKIGIGGPAKIELPPEIEAKPIEVLPLKTPGEPLFTGQNISHDPQEKIFDNAVEWLSFAVPDIKLHKWQYQMLMEMSGYRGGQYKVKKEYTDSDPSLGAMVCANGSGKDMVINAGISTFISIIGNHRVYITSASHDQLKHQTEVHIRRIAESANKKYCYRVFNSVHFYHTVPERGSDIKLFATDEASKAEGAHPFHGGKMCILINEAKSTAEDIYAAITRCSGYSWWIEISSPGEPSGS